MDTEVLVVGGGATGVGVARDLAMRGVDVALAERGGLSAGTTGRSHGLLHSGARYAESDPAGAAECARESRTLRRTAGACVAATGGYFCSLAGDDAAYVDEKRRACREAGIEATEVAPDEARAEVPGLADDLERALRVPDGVVFPSRLVAATAGDARDRGAEIRTHAPLEDLHVSGGTVTGATVDGTRVDAEVVVNATGAWAGECAALAGVEVAMRPTRGVMVAVACEGLDAVVNRCRAPADGDIVVPHADRAVCGTTSVAVEDPDEYPREEWEVERVLAECAALVPGLAEARIEATYWGVRPLYEPDERRRDDERGVSRGFSVLDHAADGADRLVSVVGGKLTTHRAMAEATADRVCEHLDVDAPCRSDEVPLAAADDPDEVDRLVREFDARSPADADVIGPG